MLLDTVEHAYLVFGPFLDQTRRKIGQFGVIWTIFGVDPGPFWGHLDIILASFWHHLWGRFGVVLTPF